MPLSDYNTRQDTTNMVCCKKYNEAASRSTSVSSEQQLANAVFVPSYFSFVLSQYVI
jgi:uncharacterized protein YgiB involved in biofilm formation